MNLPGASCSDWEFILHIFLLNFTKIDAKVEEVSQNICKSMEDCGILWTKTVKTFKRK